MTKDIQTFSDQDIQNISVAFSAAIKENASDRAAIVELVNLESRLIKFIKPTEAKEPTKNGVREKANA